MKINDNFDDFSMDIASETFNMDLDDIQLTPSLLDDCDDSDEEMSHILGY